MSKDKRTGKRLKDSEEIKISHKGLLPKKKLTQAEKAWIKEKKGLER